MRVVRLVSDGPPVAVCADPAVLTRVPDEAARLRRLLRLPADPLRLAGDGAMRATGIAGVVRLPGVVLDVVPARLAGVEAWRTALVGMLAVAEGLPWRPAPGPADHGGSLVDHLAVIVMRALEDGMRLGMPRHYVERTRRSTGVRGRLDAAEAWRHSVDRSGFVCHYSELTDEHPVVGRLAWAAGRLADLVSLGGLAGDLRETAERLPGAAEPDAMEPPIEVEAQYPYLVDAVRVANLLARCPVAGGALWSEDEVYRKVVYRVARWHPSQGVDNLPDLDLALLARPGGVEQLRASAARRPPQAVSRAAG